MATRPIFIPAPFKSPYVIVKEHEFVWFPGFSIQQAQKSIESLHEAAKKRGVYPVLEISSKSTDPSGRSMSAFNLLFQYPGLPKMPVESAFQGSKVFERGGPYRDLYRASSREAKKDERLRNSGKVVAFDFAGLKFPTQPLTAFYDWLYLQALRQNASLAKELLKFQGFSDIVFNPEKSINCQARSAALYVALVQNGKLEAVWQGQETYLSLFGITPNPDDYKQSKLF